MTTDYIIKAEMEHVLALLTPQNRLIMRMILHTGMRLSDVLAMRTDQLKPCGWYTEGKTGKRRRYGIPADLLDEIMAQAGPEWAFPGRKEGGGHKTRQAVWKDVKRASRALRLPENVAPYSGRKYYAVELLKKYGDIERVRRALNHECATVTAIYAMADVLVQRRLAARRRRSEARRRAAGREPQPAARRGARAADTPRQEPGQAPRGGPRRPGRPSQAGTTEGAAGGPDQPPTTTARGRKSGAAGGPRAR